MRKVLIISPHFPPVNAPDMQRVRISLPYYKHFGWEPIVLCVSENYVQGFKDDLLVETIPSDIEVHKVKALPERLTRKFGLGSLSLRSLFYFKKAGSELLRQKKIDLVFFSTSLFHVCALGPYWKKRFGVPFIIDMQDPWRNDFFLSKPKDQRPPKFWLSYSLDKKLEAYTMPYVDGIMSVSQGYIDTIKSRYPSFGKKPALLLPFGVATKDFELVYERNISPQIIVPGKINVVYMGAVTKFFLPLIRAFLIAFKKSVVNQTDYHFYFIGTNYSPTAGQRLVEAIAEEVELAAFVTEIPQRIPYFSALATLMHADILFVPGSSDADYNASKVYNNIFSGKPIFSIFNEKSLVKEAIQETEAGVVVGINEADTQEMLVQKIEQAMPEFTQLHLRKVNLRHEGLKNFLANTMAERQVRFFDKVLTST